MTTFSPVPRHAILNPVLGLDTQSARATWTVFLVLLLLATAYTIRSTLVIFVIALFFAYMLSPVVDFLSTRPHIRLSRPLALALVYLGFLTLLITATVSLGARLSDEVSTLAARLPDLVQHTEWTSQIPLPEWLQPMRQRILAVLQDELKSSGRDLMPYLSRAGLQIASGLSSLLYVLLIPILALFFLKDGPKLRDSLLATVPGPRRELVDDILKDLHILLGQYIRSLVLMSVSSFSCYFIFLSVTGSTYGLLLAGLAGVLEFIPVVGPAGAGIIALLVSAFTGYAHIPALLIFWICSRLFQDYVLSPYLMSAGIELHPLFVLFGVLAGEKIAGIPGMFFSVPVIAALRVIFVQVTRSRLRQPA